MAEANENGKKRKQNIEEARKIEIKEDSSWPQAKTIQIRDSASNRESRVKIYGWVHRLRRQDQALMFITLRDATGYILCVLSDLLCTYDALVLSTGSSIEIYGTIYKVPVGKASPDGCALRVDYYKVIGLAPAGRADTILNEVSHPDVQLDNRHILILDETAAKVLKMESDKTGEGKIEETTYLISQTKITDINQMCLEHIFTHLNLEDLLNVSDSNKYLKLATYMPFIRNFAGKSVKLFRAGYPRGFRGFDLNWKIRMVDKSDMKYKAESIEDIEVKDLKASFQLLRCFGGMITDLRFRYAVKFNNNRFDNFNRIVFYMSEFCSESLKKLIVPHPLIFDILDKPLNVVEHLTIEDSSHWHGHFSARLFPKLCTLSLFKCPDNTGSVLSEYVPNLVHLDLGWNKRTPDIANLLQMNPHLRSFKIEAPSYSYLNSISEYLQFLECLDVTITKDTPYDSSIYFKSVKQFKIKILTIPQILPKIPFLFDQLTDFEISGTNRGKYNIILTFFNQNRSIEKLSFTSCFRKFLLRLIKNGQLHNTLPFLKDIFCTETLEYRDEYVDFIQCIPYMDFLRSVRFFIPPKYTDDKIKVFSANKWRINRTRCNRFKDLVTLERIESYV